MPFTGNYTLSYNSSLQFVTSFSLSYAQTFTGFYTLSYAQGIMTGLYSLKYAQISPFSSYYTLKYNTTTSRLFNTFISPAGTQPPPW